MKNPSLREMNGKWSLCILIAVAVFIALILVGMPVKAADAGAAGSVIGQVSDVVAETADAARLGSYLSLETPLVSWNS